MGFWDILSQYAIIKADELVALRLVAREAAQLLAERDEARAQAATLDSKYRACMDSLGDCATRRVSAEGRAASAESATQKALADAQAAKDANAALMADSERWQADNSKLQQSVSDLNTAAATAYSEVSRLKGMVPPALEPPTETMDWPSSVIAGVYKRDLGIDVKMLNAPEQISRVVPETDFIFKFAQNVRLRPYVKDINECEHQAREFTDKCAAWGSNSAILEGDAPQGWHRWAAAVVQGKDGLVAVMVEPQTGKRVTAEYTPRGGEAYG